MELGRRAETTEVIFQEAGRPPGGQNFMMLEVQIEVASQAKGMIFKTC